MFLLNSSTKLNGHEATFLQRRQQSNESCNDVEATGAASCKNAGTAATKATRATTSQSSNSGDKKTGANHQLEQR